MTCTASHYRLWPVDGGQGEPVVVGDGGPASSDVEDGGSSTMSMISAAHGRSRRRPPRSARDRREHRRGRRRRTMGSRNGRRWATCGRCRRRHRAGRRAACSSPTAPATPGGTVGAAARSWASGLGAPASAVARRPSWSARRAAVAGPTPSSNRQVEPSQLVPRVVEHPQRQQSPDVSRLEEPQPAVLHVGDAQRTSSSPTGRRARRQTAPPVGNSILRRDGPAPGRPPPPPRRSRRRRFAAAAATGRRVETNVARRVAGRRRGHDGVGRQRSRGGPVVGLNRTIVAVR
jgi:hypothetical protein